MRAIDDEPDGFRAPIHRALITPLLLMGIPRDVCFVLWTLGAAFAFGLQEIWVLPFVLAAHAGLVVLTKIDPQFATVYRCALKTPPRLEP